MAGSASGIVDILINLVKKGTGATDAAGDLGKLQGASKDTDKSLESLTSTLLGQAAGYLSLAGAVGGFIALSKAAISEAAETETGMARLNATLIATGHGSEISAGQIDKIATSLMGVSTFDDESIVATYNALMKYESIPTGNLEQITRIAMDMSAAMGGDLQSNAESIGRLLETGLIPRTWGWSEALKEQVKKQVDAGDTAGALATVMEKLNGQFSGQAAAQLDTYNGKFLVLHNSWDEFLETLGGANLETGKGALDYLNRATISATQLVSITQTLTAENYKLLTPLEKGAALFAVYNTPGGPFKTLPFLFRDLSDTVWGYADALGMAREESNSFRGTSRDLKNDFDDLDDAMEKAGYKIKTMDWVGLASGINDAADATDMFGFSITNTTNLLKQEQAEFGFIVNFAKQYETNIKNVADAEAALLAAENDLAAARAKWGEGTQQVIDAQDKVGGLTAKLGEAQQASLDATNEMIAGFLQAQLSIDGTFDEGDMKAVLDYRREVGLLSAEAYNAALAALQIAQNLASLRNVSVSVDIYETTHRSVINTTTPHRYASGGTIEAGTAIYNEDPTTRPETIVTSAGGDVLTRQDAMAAMGGGQGVTIVYSPTISLGDREEITTVLLPLVRQALREAG